MSSFFLFVVAFVCLSLFVNALLDMVGKKVFPLWLNYLIAVLSGALGLVTGFIALKQIFF